MGRLVKDVEAAFIRMHANRVRTHTQAAASRGEEYHDVSSPTEVVSGYRVKLRHEGASAVVEVSPKPRQKLVISDALELASEVLAHPAKLAHQYKSRLEFVPDA